MVVMQYNRFRQIFNETIFERSKADLLEKIANNPMRYVGLFRPTKPKAKILQNLLQSHEIRFGDAFEQLIEEYLHLLGYNLLPKKYETTDGDILNIDQCFERNGITYFIEQKVRDDHDSTKKRGQIDNFEKKLNVLQSKSNKLIAIFYFIDDSLEKNKHFYLSELVKMEDDYGVTTKLFYGHLLFDFLGCSNVWDEILNYLKQWRDEIPDLPEINFDVEPEVTFNEIKDLSPVVFRKLFNNGEIFDSIILTLFPQKKTLNLLINHFECRNETIYINLAKILKSKI